MEELYEIMKDLLKIEYNQKSLCYIVKALEASYDMEQEEELKLIVNGFRYYLEVLQQELRNAITRMDQYLIEKK